MYYGPELTSRHFLAWCVDRRVTLEHIQPGRPMQNGHVESFHGKLRDECLNVSWFRNLFDARKRIHSWRQDYNESRPHSSLGYRTPSEFAELGQNESSRDNTLLRRGQRLQTPAPCPTPPSPLSNQDGVTSQRFRMMCERIGGAGQAHHFKLQGFVIEQLTPEGRVIARVLRLNIDKRVVERRALTMLGRYPRQ